MVKYKHILQAIENNINKSHQRLSLHLSFPKVEQTFNKFHEQTCGKKIRKTEKAICTNANGDIIYQKTGSKKSVKHNMGELKALFDEYGELYLTHNHPSTSDYIAIAHGLSSQDIQFMLDETSYSEYDENGEYIGEGFMVKSISMENACGCRMSLTRGDYYNTVDNYSNCYNLANKLEEYVINYIDNYEFKKEGIIRDITWSDKRNEFKSYDDIVKYAHNKVIEEMGVFEQNKEFKEIQKEFRENNCNLEYVDNVME